MDKPNVNVAYGGQSDMDNHASRLDEQATTFMLNGNIEGTNAEGLLMRQNEHSNILCSKFKEGFKVVGFETDINGNRTYYFLTNPETGCSEIGYIPNVVNYSSVADVELDCGCDILTKLAEPLETIQQVESCSYELLISDCECEAGEVTQCLNFDRNYPISSELKQEKCGKVLYFTDDLNPPRRIELDDLDQYYVTGVEACGEEQDAICIDCEKLRVQKNYTVPCLNFEGLVNGGNLRHGAYVFYLAYSDDNGNEVTRYMAITGEVMLKDPNKDIYQQPELDAVTNFSINLSIDNLDTSYRYYKIAVAQKTEVDGTLSYFVVGTFPTTKTKVIYDNDRNKQRLDIAELVRQFPKYDKAKTVESANNMLFFSDLEAQSEVNLQPVVNLIGEFGLWETVIAEEDIYDNPLFIEKYRGYMRDEVYPLSLRFYTNTGYVTANFPLISRIPTSDDLYFDDQHENDPAQVISDVKNEEDGFSLGWQKDVHSVLNNSNTDCVDDNRIYKWQFYNTATNEGYVDCVELDEETQDIHSQKSCEIITRSTTPVGMVTLDDFEEGEEYSTFLQYLKDHQEYFASDPAYSHLVLDNYDDPGATETTEEACCSGDDLFGQNCVSPPTFIGSEHSFRNFDNPEPDPIITYEPIGSYTINPSPDFCNIYQYAIDPDGGFEPDCEFAENILVCVDPCEGFGAFERVAFKRVSPTVGSNVCNTASDIPINFDFQIATHLNNYYGDGSIASLLDSGKTGLTDKELDSSGSADIGTDLGRNALWFKVNISNLGIQTTANPNAIPEQVVINLSEATGCEDEDRLDYKNRIRLSFWEDCNGNPLQTSVGEPLISGQTGAGISGTLDEHSVVIRQYFDGAILILNLKNYINSGTDIDEIYIAVDQPYTNTTQGGYRPNILCGFTGNYYFPGTCECFALNVYSPTIQKIEVNITDPVRLSKVCTYDSLCTVRVTEDIKCDPIAWETGRFAYVESTDIYPDNAELYDSSRLIIQPSDIPDVEFYPGSPTIREHFENVFTVGTSGDNYLLSENADFRCKGIRHFKFPDNQVVPFHDGNDITGTLPAFKKNKVFPVGVRLNNEMINALLDVAVNNGLMTQQFRDSIAGYEVFRGDVRLNKSVIGKGTIFDMYTYQENADPTKDIHFSNFPYNQLGDNYLLYTDQGRDQYIEHPHESEGNEKFTFHSPDFHFEKPGLPFEMKTEAYLTGNSRGKFSRVEGHPYMVLLGNSAYRWARALAGIEVALEVATDVTDRLLQVAQSSWFIAGLATGTNWGQAVAWVGFGTYLAERVVESIFVGVPQKRYEWLKIFDENGTPYNFAFYYTSEGFYNGLDSTVVEGDRIRGLFNREYINPGRYQFSEGLQDVRINHYQRESAVYLSLGDYDKWGLTHPSGLRNTDNSRLKLSDFSCDTFGDEYSNMSPEITRDLYVPYVSLKTYLPSQYGTIDSVDWISTNYCSALDVNDPCDTEAIFGGDIYISRFALKRKFPFFLNTMLTETGALGDFTPFDYTSQRNVGYPRYYIDYKTDMSNNFGRFEMPDIRSYQELDCFNEGRMYIEPPSKFYLYYYGIPSFLVESRINVNYRHGENERERNFYPHIRDYERWTQEQFVSIRHDNFFFYNNIFSTENDIYAYRTLPFNFNQEEWDCRFDHWDRTIYSLPDTNEQDLIDNWSSFKANNFWDFGSKYGRFVGLKPLESQKVMGRFENGFVIFNAVNILKGTVEDTQIGSGSLFETRPTEFVLSDLGYGGTQHRAFVSSEYGHFWVDAKRGRVFQVNPNGEGFDEISRNKWAHWFRDNLPFKIKKAFPNIPDEALDNIEKDVGIAMGWDDRYGRLFITKKDYELIDPQNCCIEYQEGVGFVNNLTECAGEPQNISCPEGYTYNEQTQMCEKVAQIPVSTEENCEFDLILVVDISGSITNDAPDFEMDDLKAFLTSVIHDYLAPYMEAEKVSVGIVTFNSAGALHQSMLTGAGSSSAIETAIAGLPSAGSGGTNLNAGLCAGHQELLANGRPGYDKKLLLVTDGYSTSISPCDPLFHNVGSSSDILAFQQAEIDLNGLGYECIVVGIEAENASVSQPASWVEDRWNLIHNSASNSGNAFSADSFTELVSEDFIRDVFLSACETITTCPEGEGWVQNGEFCDLIESVEPTVTDTTEVIDLNDSDCFRECSWTVAYSPKYKQWVGHYSFIPNYYVSHNNYFQTGINDDGEEFGVWSHLLTNQSYQVFYGTLYPWIIELPTKNEFINKWMETIAYWLDVRRYKNERDFAQDRNKNFDYMTVYNHDENTGKLKLIRKEPNNRHQLVTYPIYQPNQIEVLAFQEHRKWTVNHMYDIVKDKYNGVPIWIHDCNDVDKQLNPYALDYRSTKKNKLRGDWFLTRFYQTSDSQHKYVFKSMMSHNKMYKR